MVRTKAQFGISNKMRSKKFTWPLFQTSLTIMELTIFLGEISFDATEGLRNVSGFTEIFLANLKRTLHSVHMLHKATTTT